LTIGLALAKPGINDRGRESTVLRGLSKALYASDLQICDRRPLVIALRKTLRYRFILSIIAHVQASPKLLAECCRLAQKVVVVDYLISVSMFSNFFQSKRLLKKHQSLSVTSRRELMMNFQASLSHFSTGIFYAHGLPSGLEKVVIKGMKCVPGGRSALGSSGYSQGTRE
jgi:hypothetical protein